MFENQLQLQNTLTSGMTKAYQIKIHFLKKEVNDMLSA
jgi:hypothetical protein